MKITTKNLVRFVVPAIVLFLGLGMMIYVWSRQDDAVAERPKIIDESENIAAQFSSVRVIGRKQGEKQYDMTFSVVEQLDDSPVTVFSDLQDGAFFSNGEIRYFIDAGAGKWYQESDDLDMFDGVLLRTISGETINAPALRWFASQGMLVSLGKVNIQSGTANIVADTMKAYMSDREVILEGNVKVTDEEGMVVRGKKAVYDEDAKKVELFGPAEIEVVLGGGSDGCDSLQKQQTKS